MPSPSDLEHARGTSLDQLLAYHGLLPRKEGSTMRYKNDRFNIVVSDGGLWFDNTASLGGRGAIDLLLHVKFGVNPRAASSQQFREAVAWLSNFQPATGFVSKVDLSHQVFRPSKESFATQSARYAIRDDARWPLARHYLLKIRHLPSDLVDHLHQSGDIYATFPLERPKQTGVCFIHRNLEGNARGATIRRIDSFTGSFSIGEKQGAWFAVGDVGLATRAVLVEAPIDAISYAALKRPDDTAILAMSGSHATRPILDAAHARRWELAIGFDNDRPGNAGWKHCRQNYALLYPDDAQPSRSLPAGKDWNDDLRTAPRHSQGRRL